MTTDARKALESAREEIDLEPCPMCRGAARINRRSGVTGRVCRTRYYRETVACKSCKLSTSEFKTPGKAVAAWNRRAPLSAVGQKAGTVEDRKKIAAAIFDPGTTEGYKGDRTLTEWQTDAVMRALAGGAL